MIAWRAAMLTMLTVLLWALLSQLWFMHTLAAVLTWIWDLRYWLLALACVTVFGGCLAILTLPDLSDEPV